MNKSEFVKELAARSHVSQDIARRVIDAVPVVMLSAFKAQDDVRLGSEFGIFSAKVADAHDARDPGTGKTVQVPAKARLKFKAGKGFAESTTHVIVR